MNDTPSDPTPAPDDATRPYGARAAGQQTLEPGTGPGYPPAARTRFGDQVLGMRAVIAVALVALVLGGLGGALLGSLSDHGGDDGRFGGPGGFPPGGFGQGQRGQLPPQGQLPQRGQQPQP